MMNYPTHLARLIRQRASENGTSVVFKYRKASSDRWLSIRWNEALQTTDAIASGLLKSGVIEKDCIGIISPNRPEWTMTDFAIMSTGAIVVPLYPNSAVVQMEYILNETGMKLIFSSGGESLTKVAEVVQRCPQIEKVICFDEIPDDLKGSKFQSLSDFIIKDDLSLLSALNLRIESGSETDTATIIYTSGTTGEPKGVMLQHAQLLNTIRIHDERLEVSKSDVSLCFLPLSHVFERAWTFYMIHKSVLNVYLENPRQVIDILPVVQPTVMCVVPRFFEKTWQGVYAEFKRWPAIKQQIFRWAEKTGRECIPYRQTNKALPFALNCRLKLADILVRKKIRRIFGGKIRFMPCAGAAISPDILKFFHAMGIFVNYGYGLTETTATVSCCKSDDFDLDTAGTPMPGVEIKFGEHDEIMIRSKSLFTGYYKKEKETESCFEDDWFKTGDRGFLVSSGKLVMTGRIKELFKTSGGLYVSPQKVETALSAEPLFEQVMVFGDNRKYITALIVPAKELLLKYAQSMNLDDDIDRLIIHPEIQNLINQKLEVAQKDLNAHECIVKYRLLSSPFVVESGEMTPTLKLRRDIIASRYAVHIESMYH